MNRSYYFADSSAAPKVNFSEIPPDIVQNVQIAQAQSRAMAGAAPPANTQVFFSDVPPDVVQPVQAVATASALSFSEPSAPVAPAAPDLAGTVTQLRGRGVADDEIRQFLQQIGTSYTFALGAPAGVSVILPGAQLLSPIKSELLLAAISTELTAVNPALAPVLLPLFRLLPDLASRANVTIGIGPVVTGAAVGGVSLSAGIVFAPENRIGFYGSIGAVLGAIVSISATMQVTIVHGGPEVFGGTAVAATIGGGEGVVGSASVLLTDGKFIGVTFAMGVGAGLTPIESYAQYQYTATTLGLARRFA
jgi:hypothetical protein